MFIGTLAIVYCNNDNFNRGDHIQFCTILRESTFPDFGDMVTSIRLRDASANTGYKPSNRGGCGEQLLQKSK